MKIPDARKMAFNLMIDHELNDWVFTFDNAKRRFGCCHVTEQKISLSKALTRLNNEEAVKDVILHEIAHAKCPRGTGHGRLWKDTAKAIGCSATRCYGVAVKAPPYKYVATCPSCNAQFFRRRKMVCSCNACFGSFNPDCLLVWRKI